MLAGREMFPATLYCNVLLDQLLSLEQGFPLLFEGGECFESILSLEKGLVRCPFKIEAFTEVNKEGRHAAITCAYLLPMPDLQNEKRPVSQPLMPAELETKAVRQDYR